MVQPCERTDGHGAEAREMTMTVYVIERRRPYKPWERVGVLCGKPFGYATRADAEQSRQWMIHVSQSDSRAYRVREIAGVNDTDFNMLPERSA